MPEKKTIRRARKDAREGKSPSTQAGEFVREEFEHVRKGLHGAANVKQAIAIGLSKARKGGINIPTKRKAARKRKPRSAASTRPLSSQARQVARKRGVAARSATARKASGTKGQGVRQRAAQKAARTRSKSQSRVRTR